MKIVIFGTSGGTGLEVLKQVLESGHTATAFVRTPSKIDIQHPKLTVFQGDVMDIDAVKKAIVGQDAVISTLGPVRPSIPGMMETAAKNIVAAMKKHGIHRIVLTTGAGVRQPEDQPKLMDRSIGILLNLLAKEAVLDAAAYVKYIQSSDLDWTIVRFPRLMDGAHTGRYRVGYVDKHSSTQFSRADGADFILKELTEKKWLRKLPLVSY
jgi:putative NADH-flavin reductase